MNTKEFAPILVRYAMVAVFLLFGVNQLLDPNNYIGYLPDFLFSSDYAVQIVMANGIFEIVFGILLALGLFTRVAAGLLALHLLLITIEVGFTPAGFRDFGLTLTTIAIALHGPDSWCLDTKRKKRK